MITPHGMGDNSVYRIEGNAGRVETGIYHVGIAPLMRFGPA
ncbi:hypothetical protein N9891_02045 [bacterium]|nr:hypothetical protein [bacterium]